MKRMMAGLVLALSIATPAMAWDMPSMGGGDDPALASVHKQNTALLQKAHGATVQLLSAVVLLQQAAGNEAEVKRAQELAAKLKKTKVDDVEAVKDASAQVSSLVADLAKAEFAPRQLSMSEKQWLDQAVATAKACGMADAEVAKGSMALTSEVAKVGQKAMSNPMALMKVKDETGAVKALSELAAEQANAVKTFQEALVRFAASHQLMAE